MRIRCEADYGNGLGKNKAYTQLKRATMFVDIILEATGL